MKYFLNHKTLKQKEKEKYRHTFVKESVLGSILSTFYEQLSQMQIPKAQKDTDDLTIFLYFWNLCT